MKSIFCASWLGSLFLLGALNSNAAEPPSVPGIDAPELARLGPYAVGYRIVRVVQPAQIDMLSPDGSGGFALKDRVLDVDIWYPAQKGGARAAKPIVYAASLTSEPPAPPAQFTVEGIATRDAVEAAGPFPLVIVSHGYGNVTVAMTWLAENLASKGYVVAAIRHEDPLITEPAKFPQVLLRRPLDIAFVAATLQSKLAGEYHVDASRVALIGYSMGGYGVLTAAGAEYDPKGSLVQKMPGGVFLPYVRGADQHDAIHVKGLRAVVGMAPAGGGALAAWGADGLQGLTAPLLLIAGDSDRTVNYETGARAFFDAATHSKRYLLTLQHCGHAIGLNPAPETMRSALWNLDWFEDPVWRKSRITGVNTHFITAFLDRFVKGDETRAAYLDVPVADGSSAVWPAAAALPYGAYSPGTEGFTVWKGFQRKEAVGLQLLRADALAK